MKKELNNQGIPNFPENPGAKLTEKNAEHDSMADMENQLKEPASTKIKNKLSGTAKRKASSPVKSPPPKKLPDTYSRHNSRPMRSRQLPTMLGERVFTSLVDKSDTPHIAQ